MTTDNVNEADLAIGSAAAPDLSDTMIVDPTVRAETFLASFKAKMTAVALSTPTSRAADGQTTPAADAEGSPTPAASEPVDTPEPEPLVTPYFAPEPQSAPQPTPQPEPAPATAPKHKATEEPVAHARRMAISELQLGNEPVTTTVAASTGARRFAGLDGLRALAVVAVVFYHGLPGLPNAGFFGVDVFFVLSGFLITSLIVDQISQNRFSFGRFWDRRLRRIVPAVVVLLLVIPVIALWLNSDILYGFRRQVLGSITFSFNWLDVASSSSYFSEFQPELLRNLWSLAVEMQFYLVWPLLLVPLLRWLPKARAAIVIFLLAGVSVTLMALLYQPDGDPTRVYFGTDTHSFGLLIGAGLACMIAGFSRWRMRDGEPVSQKANHVLTVSGVVALASITGLIIWWDDANAFVYPWGLLIASALAGVTVLAASANGSQLGRWFDVRPLKWIGERSYGVYLWHWPLGVIMAMLVPDDWFGGDSSNWHDLATTVLSLGLSIAAAAASYRWIETPIRQGGWLALFRRRQANNGPVTPIWARLGRHIALGIAMAVSLSSLAACLIVAPAQTQAQILIEQGEQSLQDDTSTDDDQTPAGISPTPDQSSTSSASERPIETGLPMPAGKQIFGLGDSVMLGCAPDLKKQFPGISIDAQVSRSFIRGISILQTMKKQHKLRPVILVGLLTNGPVSTQQMQQMLDLVGPDVTLVFITGHAARSWIKPTNNNAVKFARAHSDNVLIADWDSAIGKHRSWLASDGVHPQPVGRPVYVTAIVNALQQKFNG